MATIYFVTHPDVMIDPNVPIAKWDLSPVGLLKTQKLLNQPWLATMTSVYASDETKAQTTATIVARKIGKDIVTMSQLGEIDRTKTGYLPKIEFDQVVAALFERPEQSARGWETAKNAQRRIIMAVNRIVDALEESQTGLVVSHGVVGALLLSYLTGQPISTALLPPGQGYYVVFDTDWQVIQGVWQPVDTLD